MSFIRLIFLFLLPLCGRAQSKCDQKILDAELRRFEAMTRRDTVALHQLLTDDLVYLHSNALLENKQEHLGAIATGKLVYQTMTRTQAAVRRYGRTAIVNGNVRVAGILNGNAFEVRLAYSAVYRKQGRRWRLANWQSTRL